MNDLQAYTKAFNKGYELQKAEPSLALIIQNGFQNLEHVYVEGFIAGIEEGKVELRKEMEEFYNKETEKQRQSRNKKEVAKDKTNSREI